MGAQVEGRVNFIAVGWVSRVNANPPYIGIGINKNHYTARGILEKEGIRTMKILGQNMAWFLKKLNFKS